MRRRPLGVGTTLFLLLLALPGPARAQLQPGLQVAPGQTVSKTFPAIPGENPQATHSNNPAECSAVGTGTACDTVPLKLLVPQASVTDYLLKVTLDWHPAVEQDAPVEGHTSSEIMDVYVWEDPPYKGSDDGTAGGFTPPTSITIAPPHSTRFNLVVRNAAGPSSGYTLTVTLLSNPPPSFTDASAGGPTGVPQYYSSGAPSSVAPGFTAPPPAAGTPTSAAAAPPELAQAAFAVPRLPGYSDPQLDALAALGRADTAGVVVSGPARRIRLTAVGGPPGAGATGLETALWLLGFPLGLIGAIAGTLRFRRARLAG